MLDRHAYSPPIEIGGNEMHKIPNKSKYYFPDRLKEKLNQISDYPLTIVEAPSGFGFYLVYNIFNCKVLSPMHF